MITPALFFLRMTLDLDILKNDDSPCRDCEHAPLCKQDGFECAAFRAWVGSSSLPGRWRPEQRTRPESLCASEAEAEKEFQRQQRRWYRRPRTRIEVQLAVSEASDVASTVLRIRDTDQREPPLPVTSVTLATRPARKRQPIGTYKAAVMQAGRDYLTRALRLTNGSRKDAAAIAGLNRTYLHLLLRQHGIACNDEQSNGGTVTNTSTTA